QHLKVDYDTFIHSAYLRQGRADEFMLKRPGERKQILADLLKLSQYDRLVEKARERGRDYQAEMKVLTASLLQAEEQLAERSAIATHYQTLQQQTTHDQQQQQTLQQQRDQLQQQQQQRQQQQQSLQTARQRLEHLHQSQQQRHSELQHLKQQCQTLQAELAAASEIETGYAQLQQLQRSEEDCAQKFRQYQQIKTQYVALQAQEQQRRTTLQTSIGRLELKLSSIEETIAELHHVLSQQATVTASINQLQTARRQLQTLDQRQMEVTPLQQRHQQIHTRLKQASARLEARLEAISQTQATLTIQQRPELSQNLTEVQHQLSYLEQRRAYQVQVRQKGQERRDFMAQLQTEQRQTEQQLIQLDQRLALLAQPEAPCPLCERPLADHGPQVVAQLQQEREILQQRLWVIREQLTTSQREIQVLRREYRQLETELEHYGVILQEQGALQAHLSSSAEAQTQLEALEQERQHLEQCLDSGNYATELQQEYQQLEQQLTTLGYDERDHALVRNQVEKLRWAEFKQAELSQAKQRLERLSAEKPEVEKTLGELRSQLNRPSSPDLLHLEKTLADLDYCPDQHQQLRSQLHTMQPWQLRYQALQQARTTLPDLEQRQHELTTAQTEQQQQYDRLQQQIAETEATVLPDVTDEIQQLEVTIGQHQTQREQQLSQLGRLEQQLQQLDDLQQQTDQQRQQLHSYQHQLRVHQELQQAFGKNGIQALMIENLLPQLEAETNQLLGRLSAHQLHVQFVTQRSGRKKLIDTLDILIADTQGTRPYETYSGGEAFRVNFAIRLALARLLAQWSGLALQMLIIDEGFGTQDQAGCDRLIAAINAIAPDFACILTVTHMPHFREAFQTRIDVIKTENGSEIRLSG
ncbi:ATP-binding cassette family protein, partial [Leptolyngbya cf. ectocarpi LEGE 11479]